MAKGINIFGTLAGTLGETVYYRSGGVQKQRIRVRRPNNPQTNAQMVQRGRFAAAGKFYTRGKQAFFPFAFEDRKKYESNFNAFMRHNIKIAYPISKSASESIAFPVINNWQVTYGSLPTLVTESMTGFAGVTGSMFCYGVMIKTGTTLPTTMAQLSQALIATGDYENGDIITLLVVSPTIAGDSFLDKTYPTIYPSEEYDSETAPRWIIQQFTLNVNDTNPLSAYGIHVQMTSGAIYVAITPSVEINGFTGITYIHSRKTKTRTVVSSQKLNVLPFENFTIDDIKENASKQTYYTQVADNWRGTISLDVLPTEILQGSNSVNIDFEPVGE